MPPPTAPSWSASSSAGCVERRLGRVVEWRTRDSASAEVSPGNCGLATPPAALPPCLLPPLPAALPVCGDHPRRGAAGGWLAGCGDGQRWPAAKGGRAPGQQAGLPRRSRRRANLMPLVPLMPLPLPPSLARPQEEFLLEYGRPYWANMRRERDRCRVSEVRTCRPAGWRRAAKKPAGGRRWLQAECCMACVAPVQSRTAHGMVWRSMRLSLLLRCRQCRCPAWPARAGGAAAAGGAAGAADGPAAAAGGGGGVCAAHQRRAPGGRHAGVGRGRLALRRTRCSSSGGSFG